MTKRQFLAPLAILPLAALALAGCATNEKPGTAQTTAPAVVTGAQTVPEDGLVHSKEPTTEAGGAGEAHVTGATATADLSRADGTKVGTATFTESGGAVVIDVRVVGGLKAGFHGMHIHSVGKCEGPDFTSAGGHWQKDGATAHPMTGDLVSIFVNDSGKGQTVTSTSAFTLKDIKDRAEGNALIIHAGPDNFANIPPRYSVNGQPGPDEDTMKTGDAGARAACGVIKVG